MAPKPFLTAQGFRVQILNIELEILISSSTVGRSRAYKPLDCLMNLPISYMNS